MILESHTVQIPGLAERDADIGEYGEIGQDCRVQYGIAAMEAGAPDYPDGEGTEAAQTGAVDVIANVLHALDSAGGDVEAAIRSARAHYAAEAAGE